ncbi:Positive regulator of purine utilization [Lachnellula hyalina]|uniref:Positive regulator of purine utilization n=1 Tax=Lachnellula hyalina TaxID=1316788 RepID=A0A8H8R1A1_9HELO|nr:Positive regulator of purine utilization [Lachnellula hyalina]TVY26513.1 Positive regulator of purine utilization [Lachnellula hyalina]
MPRPSPSVADTPLLRVSRPVSACSRCESIAILHCCTAWLANDSKCDGKLPACTACEKSGRAGECSSANDQFAKGKERSYVASLESRVEKLERRLAYARSRKASVAMHDIDAPFQMPDRKDSLANIRAAIHGKAARRREAADVNELVSDFGFLSVNATTRDFETSTSNMTFARLILAATNNDILPESQPFQLPSRPAAMVLIQYYLDHVYALFPVFSETALLNALDATYQENGRPVTEFEYWLLYFVFAIASTAQSRSHRDALYVDGVHWVGRALHYADKVLMPGYVSQIQALLLLVQYSMLDPAHFDSWHLIGFACRAVVDLGFHQDPPKEQQLDKKTAEMRRRIFYCVYSLDRSISMVHARSLSFTDDSTSVDFPSLSLGLTSGAAAKSLTGPHSLESADLLFQLRCVQSSWYQELFQSGRSPLHNEYTYIWQICQEMREWSESFPESLPLAFKDFFDLELLYSYVYCLSPSCRIPALSLYAKTLIFEYSIDYMQKIFPISRDPINVAFYTYHDALRVYFVGSQFLAVLMSDQDQLLGGILPYTPIIPGTPPPPPLPSNAGINSVDRSINCVKHIKGTLRSFGHRWDDSKALLSNYEAQVEPLLASLHQRKHHIDGIARNSNTPPGFVQQASFDHMGNISTESWANAGVAFASNSLQGGLGLGQGGSAHGL